MPKLPNGKIAIFIGAHEAFEADELKAIDEFCENNNAIVLCDHIGNYHGKYMFLASKVNIQQKDFGLRKFDLIIYIGSVEGTYIKRTSNITWRVNRDGIIRDPYNNLTCVFEMEEKFFFKQYANDSVRVVDFTRGNEQYKYNLGGVEVNLYSYQVNL